MFWRWRVNLSADPAAQRIFPQSQPQNNPDGYEATSCLRAAGDLHGHLVLVHGTMDDNVHLQNALQFAYELQKADQQFELMLYPRSRHGVRDRDQRWHLRQLEWQAIQDHLIGG